MNVFSRFRRHIPEQHAVQAKPERRELTLNTSESHIAVSVVVDTSYSMDRDAPQSHECYSEMIAALRRIPSVARRVDTQVVTAGGKAKVIVPFQSVLEITCPEFVIGGGTPLGEAGIMSLDGLQAWKAFLTRNETELVSSILVIISDGEANDHQHIERAKSMLRDAQESVTVIPFLTNGGSRTALEDFCGCRALDVSETDIPRLFERLTQTIRTVSVTSPRLVDSSFVRNLMFGGKSDD